eukprot:426654-Pleurochrysis_carterae.AAC.1
MEQEFNAYNLRNQRPVQEAAYSRLTDLPDLLQDNSNVCTARVIKRYVDSRIAGGDGGSTGNVQPTTLNSLTDVNVTRQWDNMVILSLRNGEWQTEYQIVNDDFNDNSHYLIPTLNQVQRRIDALGLRSGAYYNVNAHPQSLESRNDLLPTSQLVKSYIDNAIQQNIGQAASYAVNTSGVLSDHLDSLATGRVIHLALQDTVRDYETLIDNRLNEFVGGGGGSTSDRVVNDTDTALLVNAHLPSQAMVRAYVFDELSVKDQEIRQYADTKFQDSINFTNGFVASLADGAYLDVLSADE